MVTTGCEFERPFHVDWLVSMHQKKLPTVWRIASTMSGPEAAADTVFGPKKYWPHFNPAPMALIAIQASGRARIASSCHTSCSRHWLASRPENPHSSE